MSRRKGYGARMQERTKAGLPAFKDAMRAMAESGKQERVVIEAWSVPGATLDQQLCHEASKFVMATAEAATGRGPKLECVCCCLPWTTDRCWSRSSRSPS